ncbi:MAG: class I SAM-dependent methyltransferase [SAR324 cluster bacterium]|nr:class I SAM-dependent methyltransferase [SAR324 cluster bacterium]
MSGGPAQAVEAHYSSQGLGERILAALKESGKDPAALSRDDLAPVDEFHTRGRLATAELAEFARLKAGQQVVDVGSGLGGPARHLAEVHGCRVTGLDLTEEFCRVAAMLSERTGLDGQVSFRHGSALEMPFEDQSFDVAWTVQAQMNIADKARFYGEIHRVLKPGGRLVFQDLFQGQGGEIYCPVPWAGEPSISFLVPPAEARETAEAQGFRVTEWRDVTATSLAWYAQQPDASGKPLPPLGLHLIMGPDARLMRENQLRNLQEGRVVLVQAMLEKQG